MEKKWFILIEGNSEGPFSIQELKLDLRINPETLVWREGFEEWVPIGQVPELKEVFSDGGEKVEEEEEEEPALPVDEEITLQMKEDPPATLLIFIILVICLCVYLLMKYF